MLRVISTGASGSRTKAGTSLSSDLRSGNVGGRSLEDKPINWVNKRGETGREIITQQG